MTRTHMAVDFDNGEIIVQGQLHFYCLYRKTGRSTLKLSSGTVGILLCATCDPRVSSGFVRRDVCFALQSGDVVKWAKKLVEPFTKFETYAVYAL